MTLVELGLMPNMQKYTFDYGFTDNMRDFKSVVVFAAHPREAFIKAIDSFQEYSLGSGGHNLFWIHLVPNR